MVREKLLPDFRTLTKGLGMKPKGSIDQRMESSSKVSNEKRERVVLTDARHRTKRRNGVKHGRRNLNSFAVLEEAI